MINIIGISTSGGYKGEPSFQLTDPLAIAFANQLLLDEGYSLTNVEAESLNNFCIRIKGEDPLYANFGDSQIYDAASAFQICPMLGETLGTKKYNLMNAASATFRLSFYGGCTANYDGVTTDGVSGYISSNIMTQNYAALNNSSVAVGCVIRDSSSRYDFGTYSTGYYTDGNLWRRLGITVDSRGRSWTNDNYIGPEVDTKGHTWINLFGTPCAGQNYHNGVLESINSLLFKPSSNEYQVLPFNALSFDGTVYVRPANTTIFEHFFEGLSPASVPVWNTIVDDFMIELGKKTW